jgi:hypothetical protein
MAQGTTSDVRPKSAGVDLGMSSKSFGTASMLSMATVDLSALNSTMASTVNSSAPASPARHR